METVEKGMNGGAKMTVVILIFAPSSKLCIDTISNLKKKEEKDPAFSQKSKLPGRSKYRQAKVSSREAF